MDGVTPGAMSTQRVKRQTYPIFVLRGERSSWGLDPKLRCPRRHSLFVISARYGKLGCAPARVTESEAARSACLIAFSMLNPFAMPVASHPVKQSPAPTVSTALARGTGKCRIRFESASNAPLAPRVMTTQRQPWPIRSFAERIGSFVPVMTE